MFSEPLDYEFLIAPMKTICVWLKLFPVKTPLILIGDCTIQDKNLRAFSETPGYKMSAHQELSSSQPLVKYTYIFMPIVCLLRKGVHFIEHK